jgi:hypothetical protein
MTRRTMIWGLVAGVPALFATAMAATRPGSSTDAPRPAVCCDPDCCPPGCCEEGAVAKQAEGQDDCCPPDCCAGAEK